MRRFLLAAALLLLLPFGRAHAQTPFGNDGVWMTFSGGTAGSGKAINLNTSYSFARGETTYQLAGDYTGAIAFLNPPAFYSASVSGLVGRRNHGRHFLLAQYVGPSLLYHVDRDDVLNAEAAYVEQERRRFSPGLAANAQFFVKPLGRFVPELGIGLEAFANLNAVRSHYGLRLALLIHNTL